MHLQVDSNTAFKYHSLMKMQSSTVLFISNTNSKVNLITLLRQFHPSAVISFAEHTRDPTPPRDTSFSAIQEMLIVFSRAQLPLPLIVCKALSAIWPAFCAISPVG